MFYFRVKPGKQTNKKVFLPMLALINKRDRSFFERTPACSSINLHSSGETDSAKKGEVLFCSERNKLSFLGRGPRYYSLFGESQTAPLAKTCSFLVPGHRPFSTRTLLSVNSPYRSLVSARFPFKVDPPGNCFIWVRNHVCIPLS